MKEYICKEDIRNKLYDEDAITMRGVNIINNYPAADVRPVVHGKWIDRCDRENLLIISHPYECSVCKAHEARRRNYCPNCGADMREDKT